MICYPGKFPVRWMAPESLSDGIFSPASDIWSYGILLYEILTFGTVPYQGFSNREVLEFVKNGNRIILPSACPRQAYVYLFICVIVESAFVFYFD